MIQEDRRLWKLLLLTIPTLGIYNIVFWYQLTKDLNEMNKDEKRIKNYILVIFLSIITLGNIPLGMVLLSCRSYTDNRRRPWNTN